MFPQTTKALWVWLLCVFGACALVFIAFPGVDIGVSSLFYRDADGFWLDNGSLPAAYRRLFNNLSVSLAVMSFFFWAVAYWRSPVLDIGYRVWAFVTMLYVLGPGLLVNGIAKSVFGRARPADIVDFGGDDDFTRAFEISDQCEGNCSFVSGEGSSATAFFISVFVLSRFVGDEHARRLLVAGGFVLAFIAATLRVMKGRHFLSDTVFSVLFVSAVALLLSWLLLRREKPG